MCAGPVGVVGSIDGIIAIGRPGRCGSGTGPYFKRARADGLDHKGCDRAINVRFVALIFQVGQGDGGLCILIDGTQHGSEGRQCWYIVDRGDIDRDGVGRGAADRTIVDFEPEGIIGRTVGLGHGHKF